MSNDAPDRILARADRNGAQWKAKQPSRWFGEAFEDVEYIHTDIFEKSIEVKEATALQERNDFLTKRVEQLEQALSDLLPYTDAIICYASTISEHDGNRVAKVLADLAEKVK